MKYRPINYDHRIERDTLLPEIRDWLTANVGAQDEDWNIIIFSDMKFCNGTTHRYGHVLAVAIADPTMSTMFRMVYGHEIGNTKTKLFNS